MMRTVLCSAMACLMVLWVLLAAAGCERDIYDTDVTVVDLEQMRRYQQEAVADARVRIVDVRQPEQFRRAHIPGAVNIPLPQISRGHELLAGARRVVFYSATGTDYLSRAAAKKAMRQRQRGAVEFRGGLEAWAEAGLPLAGEEAQQIETDPAPPPESPQSPQSPQSPEPPQAPPPQAPQTPDED